MGSTVRSAIWPQSPELGFGSLRWRDWPLVDRRKSSWLMPLLIVTVAFGVYWLTDSVILPLAASICLAITLWSFLLPTSYEVTPLGLRRRALGRVRLFPWQAVRAYQLRPTGAVLFRQPDPTPINIPRSLFVPFPPDVDELIVALRLYLPHAVEVPADFGSGESNAK
jgi:hypothetical protein